MYTQKLFPQQPHNPRQLLLIQTILVISGGSFHRTLRDRQSRHLNYSALASTRADSPPDCFLKQQTGRESSGYNPKVPRPKIQSPLVPVEPYVEAPSGVTDS
jgi:hypothetical protein